MEVLIFPVVFAVITAAIASSKGRSVIGWFFCGFFLGLIGLIIICVLSNLKDERANRERMNAENRRLREQLKQERIKAESFREFASKRLDVHDEKLGIDTKRPAVLGMSSATTPLLEGSSNDAFAAVPARPGTSQFSATEAQPAEWFYESRGESKGPVTSHEIKMRYRRGEIDRETLVWCEGMADWQPLRSTKLVAGSPT